MKKVLITLATLAMAATALTSCKTKDSKIEAIDSEGKTIYLTINDGNLCYYEGGTPVKYCDKCHAILAGGTYVFEMGSTRVEGCKKCVDEAIAYYYSEYDIKLK